MVARVAAGEHHVGRTGTPVVADPEAQHPGVEVDRPLQVGGAQHDVAEAQVAVHEAETPVGETNRSWSRTGPRTAPPGCRRGRGAHQASDLARRPLRLCRLLDPVALGLELSGGFMESGLVRQLPTREGQALLAVGGLDEDPVGPVVDLYAEGLVAVGVDGPSPRGHRA